MDKFPRCYGSTLEPDGSLSDDRKPEQFGKRSIPVHKLTKRREKAKAARKARKKR